MTESRCIHSQELYTAASATACLAATGILNDLPGLTSCCCNNIGLVSLSRNYMSYITVQGIPILSLLIFMPSHSNLKNFFHLLVEYRDGIKSKEDKIGMPCTYHTVHAIRSPRESTAQALYCHTK